MTSGGRSDAATGQGCPRVPRGRTSTSWKPTQVGGASSLRSPGNALPHRLGLFGFIRPRLGGGEGWALVVLILLEWKPQSFEVQADRRSPPSQRGESAVLSEVSPGQQSRQAGAVISSQSTTWCLQPATNSTPPLPPLPRASLPQANSRAW